MILESLSHVFRWLDEHVGAADGAQREEVAPLERQAELGDEWLTRYLFDRDSRQDEAEATAR